MATGQIRHFFGEGYAKPIRIATDLIGYLREDRRHHYRDGYSMAEAAKCWVQASGRLPDRIVGITGAHVLTAAHFEYEVVVWGGGKSTSDIMAFVPEGVIAVEAKARESFDHEVHAWEKAGTNERSRANRSSVIDRYAEALSISREALLPIRYQLLHRTLSAALTARKYGLKQAWMVVQSFAPLDCDERHRNRADFERYLALVGTAPLLMGIPVQLAWIDETT